MADDKWPTDTCSRIDVRWKAAILAHNEGLKKGRKSLRYILLEGEEIEHVPGKRSCARLGEMKDIEDLISVAEGARDTMFRRRWKSRIVFSKILGCLQTHSAAITASIQHQPEISSLVWGSVRFLIQVASDSKLASELVVEGIWFITYHVPIWLKMATTFIEEQSDDIYLTRVYTQLLDFLTSAVRRCQKRSWVRWAPSIHGSEAEKFCSKLKNLREAVEALRDASQTECNLNSIKELQAIRSLMLEHQHAESASKSGLDKPPMDGIRCWVGALSKPLADLPAITETVYGSSDADPWLVSHPKFEAWQQCDAKRLLLVTGDPGCGKSVLAYRTLKSLQRHQPSTTVISHAFRSSASAEERKPITLAASVLSQLWDRGPESSTHRIYEDLVPFHRQSKARFSNCRFIHLWDYCVSLLGELDQYTLVIDGLDESLFDGCEAAENLFKKVSALLDLHSSARIVIFTRPIAALGIGTGSDTGHARRQTLQITAEDTEADINAFCERTSAKLGFPDELQTKICNIAKATANGSFQYASLFFSRVDKADTLEQLDAVLKEPPKTFWSFYLDTWINQFKQLDAKQRKTCRTILLILLGARSKLTVRELESAADLIPGRSPVIISQYCEPLVRIFDNTLQLSHASVRDFLLGNDPKMNISGAGFAQSEPDEVLARRCLECLLRDDYSSLDQIGRRVRKNVSYGNADFQDSTDSDFYRYAAQHWADHLTALGSPAPDLLLLACRFLHSANFVYWSEFCYKDVGDFEATRSTEIQLALWSKTLSDEERSRLCLHDYVEHPYRQLHTAYLDKTEDKILPWLVFMRLGGYFFTVGKVTKLRQVVTEVSTRLSDILGPKDPLTLQARSDAAYALIYDGKMQEARDLYDQIAKDQKDVLGEDDAHRLFTLIYQAQAMYCMADNVAAIDTLSDALAGFLRTLGPESNGALAAQFWYAIVQMALGKTALALDDIVYVRDKRKEQFGPEDSFALSAQLVLGDLYRRLGRKTETFANLGPSVLFRRQVWPMTHWLTIDSILLLAIAHRDFERPGSAFSLLQELEESGALDDDEHFFQFCQTKHLKSLLLFDGGEVDEPLKILQELLVTTDRARNNRALLWIRLDLADMLRYRNGDGDRRLASSLFDRIVEHATEADGEPDPPRLLELAEKALRLVRSGQSAESEDLLRREDLRWVRREDFWLQIGTPAADTGVMKPPQGLGSPMSLQTWELVDGAARGGESVFARAVGSTRP